MPTISISRDMLIKAVAAEVKRQSFGVASLEVTNIEGVIESGESFEIVGIRVQAEKPKPTAAEILQRTPPAGQGKIRLAAIDGEAL